MEKLIITILIFVIGLINANAKSKKTAKNAPGQKPAARPATVDRNAAGQRADAKPQPTTPKTPSVPEPVKEAAKAIVQPEEAQVLDKTDYARDDMAEGESRECDHGSVGGSMDITDHAGLGEEFVHAQQQVKTTVATSVVTRVKVSRDDMPAEEAAPEEESAAAAFGGMTADQMRQAVIMAEILKRPSERFRRWPVQ